jgi:outer membrane receptor protein involved in Fe transport
MSVADLLVVIGALVGAGASAPAQAQERSTGRLEGRLTRPDGSGLAGATVTIEPGRRVTLTDTEGRFVLEPAPAEAFSVVFSLGGHRLTVTDVRTTNGVATLDRTVDWPVSFRTITVSSASRGLERLFEAPASVAVVDGQAIAAQAAHAQFPAVLAGIPGVEVTQSGVFDFNLNLRGLNAALNRRVLVLVDGRDPSSVLIGAQEWAAFGLPFEKIARVEVVRGPGAALYGSNAFNGVIDITTRRPQDAKGGQIDLTFGEAESLRVASRHAGALNAQTAYEVHAAFSRSSDFFRSRVGTVEYPGLPTEVQVLRRDRSAFVSAGGRIDREIAPASWLTAEGGWARTDGNVLLSGAGRIQNLGAHRPWLRSSLRRTDWQIAGYYDGRYGDLASLAAGNTIVDRSQKLGVEVQRQFQTGARGSILAGAAYRFQFADTRDAQGAGTILRDVSRAHERSAFAQWSFRTSPTTRVVVATRVDGSTLHDVEVSPKAAFVYSMSARHSVRVSYGHAFQTGSFVHYFTRTAAAPPVNLGALEAALRPVLGNVSLGFSSVPVLALGNNHLEPERVDSYEAGYSGVFGPSLLVSFSYYYNRISDLVTPLVPQVGTELGRINPTYQPYTTPPGLSPAQQAVVMGALRASLPASLFATMSNDLDGAPIFAVVSYTNLGQSRLQGYEAGVRYLPEGRISFDVGVSGLRFTSQQLVDPLVTANAPPHMITAGMTYRGAKTAVSLRYRWSDQFNWSGGVFRGTVPAASVADLTARYTLRQRTALHLNIANLFDNRHHEIFGGDVLRRRALVSLTQSW